MKGLSAGLILGFALGAGVMYLARPEPEAQRPPAEIRRSEPRSEPTEPPALSTSREPPLPEAAPAQESPTTSVAAVRARYAHRSPIPDLTDDQLQSLLREMLLPQHGLDAYELARLAGDEIQNRPEFPVTQELVDGLLSAKDVALHRLGSALLPRVRPFRPDWISDLVARHPNQVVRRAALREWGRFARQDERFLKVVLSATKDRDAPVKIEAAGILGSVARQFPEAAEWLIEAAEGKSPVLLRAVARHLDQAGTAGVDCAVRLLCNREDLPDSGYDLAKIVVKAGRVRELLDRRVPPRSLRAALHALSGLGEEQRERELRTLTGRFGEIWERVRVLFEDPQLVFDLAARAGDAAFLQRVGTSTDSTPTERSRAVYSALIHPGTGNAGLAGARSVLGDATTQPELRMEVLDYLEETLDFPDTLTEEVRAILSNVAANDPSPEIRETAKEMLWGE